MRKNIIQAHNLTLKYGIKNIFEDISLEIGSGEKIGLIGVNGSGKSSLMKVLSGIVERDAGDIYTNGSVSIAYLSQDPTHDISIWQKLPILQWLIKKSTMGAGIITESNEQIDQKSEPGLNLSELLIYEASEKIKNNNIITVGELISWQRSIYLNQLEKMGFDHKELIKRENDFNINYKKINNILNGVNDNCLISNLSGGEQRKLGLALLLSLEPDLLLIDEPTNHLDLEAISALENYLNGIKTAFIFVSHDRYFINNVAASMWEINGGKLNCIKGGYDEFIDEKVNQKTKAKTETWKQKQYLKRELEWVKSGVKARGTKDKGRLHRFEQDTAEFTTNKHTDNILKAILPPVQRLGSRIIDIKESCVEIGEKKLWHKFTHNIQKNQKIGLIGANGSGKSTLLKFLMQEHLAEFEVFKSKFTNSGTIKIGTNSHFLYFDQHKRNLDWDMTPLEFIGRGREIIEFGPFDQTIPVRRYLSNWLFSKTQYSTKICNLSGGEQSRLLLASSFLRGGNVLILDEPTNDLDLETLMVLEQTLNDFSGVIILISHDRTFINRVCNHIWFLENGQIKSIAGNYDNYLNFVAANQTKSVFEINQIENKNKNNLLKTTKQIKILEIEISKIELKISDLHSRLQNPDIFRDLERFKKLQAHLEREEKELSTLMNHWEELSNI
jgi:ABC transport system ATP-binding/permease protein